MKSLLFIILYFMVIQGLDGCEPDWVSYRQFCYFFSTTEETHATAKSTCIDNDAALAKIEDHNAIDFVTMQTNTSHTLKLRIYFMRGLCLDGVTFTIQRGVPIKYTHWKPNEPNNLDVQQCLVLVLKSNSYDLTERKMASQYCTSTFYYICRKPSETITTTLRIDTSATSTDIAEETTTLSTTIANKLDTIDTDAHKTNTATPTSTTSGTGTSAVPNTNTTASTAMTSVSGASAFPSTRVTDTPSTSTTASTAITSGSDTSASSSATATDAPITSAAASTAFTSGSDISALSSATDILSTSADASTAVTNATTTLTVTSDSSTSILSTDASVADNSPAMLTSYNPSISPETNNGVMSETSLSTDDPISSTSKTVRSSRTTETNSSRSTSSTQIPVVVNPTKRMAIIEQVDFVSVIKEAEGSVIIGVLGIVIICTMLFCIVCSDVGVIRRNFKYLKENLSIV